MLSLKAILLSLVATISLTNARSATGDRVLVVLEQQISKDDYSQFWASLEERGFELTFKTPKDDKLELKKFGENQYDHLILYAPSTKAFSTGLSPKSIVDAQFSGLNTLYLLSSNISEIHRDTFREYDLEFVERDTTLLDAFSHPPSSPLSTVLLQPSSCLVSNPNILSDTTLTGGPIVYSQGTVHTLGQNPYIVEVAHAPKTAYVGEERIVDPDEKEVENTVGGKGKGKEGLITGRKAALVSAFQTRDNARIGFVGSGKMLSDEYWGKSVEVNGQSVHTGNAAFASDFTKWLFQETGVVKIISSTHHREGETEPKELYRIKDELTYSLTLAQHHTTPNGTSTWIPVSLSDLQLDFTMLDPHIRTALKEDKTALVSTRQGGTVYTAKFKAPDRHGVFKFVVEYWRPGWSYIRTSSTASVVPFRHDEYPRFILGAWPFYSSSISVSAAFLLFCVLWLSLGEDGVRGKGKKAE